MDAGSLGVLALMVAVFYFLLIRPQQRRAKAHVALVSSLGPGDDVITVGGILGRITKIEDQVVWLEVADGTEIRFSRQAISRKVNPDTDEAPEGAEDAGAKGAGAEGAEDAG